MKLISLILYLNLIPVYSEVGMLFEYQGDFTVSAWGSVEASQESVVRCNVCPILNFGDNRIATLTFSDKSKEEYSFSVDGQYLLLSERLESETPFFTSNRYLVSYNLRDNMTLELKMKAQSNNQVVILTQ